MTGFRDALARARTTRAEAQDPPAAGTFRDALEAARTARSLDAARAEALALRARLADLEARLADHGLTDAPDGAHSEPAEVETASNRIR